MKNVKVKNVKKGKSEKLLGCDRLPSSWKSIAFEYKNRLARERKKKRKERFSFMLVFMLTSDVALVSNWTAERKDRREIINKKESQKE